MKTKQRQIIKYIDSETLKASSYATMYKWENIISQALNIKIKKQRKITNWIYRQIEKRLRLRNFYNNIKFINNYKLKFVMKASIEKSCRLDKKTIPIIIDFWLEESELNPFYENYKYCPLVIITSAEVFHYLKLQKCPLNIEHWPISLPNDFKFENLTEKDKIYELATIGRVDPYFTELLSEYCKRYPEFEYVIGNQNIDKRYYYSNKGRMIDHSIGEDGYKEIIKKTKITFYSTPGLDLAKSETTKFNQITPRFLELIAGKCLILAHYKENEDSKYFEITKFCRNIDNYQIFEEELNKYRKIKFPDNEKYENYLEQHYTTARINSLKKILEKNHIQFR